MTEGLEETKVTALFGREIQNSWLFSRGANLDERDRQRCVQRDESYSRWEYLCAETTFRSRRSMGRAYSLPCRRGLGSDVQVPT